MVTTVADREGALHYLPEYELACIASVNNVPDENGGDGTVTSNNEPLSRGFGRSRLYTRINIQCENYSEYV